MKRTATIAGGTGAAGGGYAVYDNWYCWGPGDFCIYPYVQDQVLPLLVLSLLVGSFVLWRLWRRVKALEAK